MADELERCTLICCCVNGGDFRVRPKFVLIPTVREVKRHRERPGDLGSAGCAVSAASVSLSVSSLSLPVGKFATLRRKSRTRGARRLSRSRCFRSRRGARSSSRSSRTVERSRGELHSLLPVVFFERRCAVRGRAVVARELLEPRGAVAKVARCLTS